MKIDIFSPVEIDGIQMNNRIIRSATDESMADEFGRPTEKLTRLYSNLAKGEVGGIITGFIAVSEEGKSTMPGMCSLHSDENIESFKNMVDEIHKFKTPIIAQIVHCGRQSVSGKKYDVNKMNEGQFHKMIDDFTETAVRCRKAGFDGIQVHCAHGYFLSEILSPKHNHRKDAFGGSKEKRVALVEMIIQSIRKEMVDYPIFIKLNGEESVKNGIKAEDAAWYAKAMEKAGASAIEVSRGLQESVFDMTRGQVPIDMILKEYHTVSNLPKPVKTMIKPFVKKLLTPSGTNHLYNLDAAKTIKKNVTIPVIVVGGIRTVDDCEYSIESGMDMVSISRPLIIEPGLVGKWKSGKQKDSKCINCNYCLIGIDNHPLRCYYGKLPK